MPQLQFNSIENRLFLLAVVTLVGRTMLDMQLFSIPLGLQRIVAIIFSRDLSIALLAIFYYQGGMTQPRRALAISLLMFQVAVGLSTGMTQDMLQPLLIWYLCRWFVMGTVPYRWLVMLGVLFLLLQPVKLDYRQVVWFGGKNFSFVDKIGTYNYLFWKHWLGQGNILQKGSDTTAGRLSLLLQTAHVVERTPSMVPFKNGETLMYMVYTWVPRFLWPDKPIAQQANIDFALEYGIQHPSTIDTARFGIGHLGEAYINFGVVGIFAVFFCLGGFYFLPIALVPIDSGDVAAMAILAAVLVNFIFIGSTIGNVFGSVIQQVIVQAFIIKFFCSRKGLA